MNIVHRLRSNPNGSKLMGKGGENRIRGVLNFFTGGWLLCY